MYNFRKKKKMTTKLKKIKKTIEKLQQKKRKE